MERNFPGHGCMEIRLNDAAFLQHLHHARRECRRMPDRHYLAAWGKWTAAGGKPDTAVHHVACTLQVARAVGGTVKATACIHRPEDAQMGKRERSPPVTSPEPPTAAHPEFGSTRSFDKIYLVPKRQETAKRDG